MLDKIKELTKDTAVYGISTIIGRFLNFLLVPFYTNVFVKSEFGEFTLIYAYLSFFNVLFIYGMDAAFMKYYSLAGADDKKGNFSTPFVFVFLTTVFFSAFMLIFHGSLGVAADIPLQYSNILIYVIIILFLDTTALIPFAYLRLERKTKKFAFIKLGNIIINLALNFILILGFNYGIEAIFISNLVASAFSLLALLPDIFSKLRFYIDKTILTRMLKFAIPYLPGSLAAMFVQVIDIPIVRALTDDSTLGLYRANYKLGLLMMLFVSMFNYAWQPFFLNNASDEKAKSLFAKILTIFLLVCSSIWIVLSLFIDDLAKIKFWGERTLIGGAYLEGLFIVPVILLAYIFYGMYINFTAGIYIKEKTKYFPLITGAAAIANITANILLVPVLNIMGAALATLLSYFMMAAGLFFVSQKFYKINYEYVKIFKIFLVILITLLAYYILLVNGLLLLPVKFILLVIFISALLAAGVVERSEIISVTNILLRRNTIQK